MGGTRFLLLSLLGLAGLAAVPSAVSGSSAATTTAAQWGKAIEVPGTRSLNNLGRAEVTSVSCASVGNCAVGGFYTSGDSEPYAFVGSEKNGRWGHAIHVQNTASASVNAVSCASAGNCAAGGTEVDGQGGLQAFLASEKSGSWGGANYVPGGSAGNVGGFASVNAVSCVGAGYCAAGGYYTDGLSHPQAFVVTGLSGAWNAEIEVPGTATLNSGGNAGVYSVSCAVAGNCAAGGFYTDGSDRRQAFVVSEKNHNWSTAIKVPGSATLNRGGTAVVYSVSCAAAGSCAAGGQFTDRAHHRQAFVVSETNGIWSKAIKVPGSASLNRGGNAVLYSVSCGAAGNCAAGGFYTDGSHHRQAFVVSETNGSWGKATKVPRSVKLNSGGNAAVYSVSCAAAGNCVAGGSYKGFGTQTFVSSSAP